MSFKSLKISIRLLLAIFFLVTAQSSKAQIYSHNFGTAAISSHPYTVAPTVLNPNLSNSSWRNSVNAWTSTTGSAGQAIRLTASGNETITLTFNVNANYKASITSFNFWTQRSNLGPQNWTMSINGTNVGSGTVGTTGASIGNTNVSNAISGLTGSVSVVISLSGSTGNGTLRLDDFTLNGSVVLDCTASTITSIVPATGPQNTLVTINGSGFQAGSGTSSVEFNGIPSSFTVISDTQIQAYVPAGNATGNIKITTNGCPGVSSMNFIKIVSDNPINYSSDIYISEVHDVGTTGDGGIGGSGGIIEIYNGTASTVNLAGYSVKRYGDIGDANPSITPLNLVGSIPPGGIFLLGLGSTTCSVSYDQTFNTGFNENDEFELLKNGVIIDNVHLLFALSGYTLIRKPDAVAPKAVFNGNDWYGYDLERCTNIGIHNVSSPALPTVTHPTSKTVCESAVVTFTAPLSNPAGYTFQWKVVNASGVWTDVVNGMQYSGATTNTLTINAVPSTFNNNQYYCKMTSASKNVVSNAAQLKVNVSLVPDFPTTLTICSGEAAPALNATSPNGISGTWSPATINNTINGSYTFTPNSGQCATNFTLNVRINNRITPDFPTVLTICNGETPMALNATSPNGIVGTWSPSAISNTTNGIYTFTPNSGQCATNATLNVTVTSIKIPDFPTTLNLCNGETAPPLNATSPNGITGTWSPATISNTTNGSYTFTPNAGQCASNATLNVIINNRILPDFNPTLTVCNGGTVPALNATSPNGITGTWNPAVISNTANGIYTFTPNAGQCATNATLNVAVASSIIPDFQTALTICNGQTVPPLNTTSPNGITGTWNPSTINNTTNGSYLFTPNPGQCAVNLTLNVAITSVKTPDFPTTLNLCNGETPPVLSTTSPNGITGTWSPSVVSNTTNGNYIFTPNTGQCATNATLNVTINNRILPDFNTALTLCNGDPVPVLNAISPNGITGTWSPATISNTANGIYTFTPNSGQCASTTNLNVSVTQKTIPDFDRTLILCNGATAPPLNLTSPNGITGTWSPSVINNTTNGIYTFTPNSGQCATNATLNVTVTTTRIPNFPTTLNLCNGETAPALNATSPNGISGTWSPSVINNTTNGNYTFTPNAGQCATNFTLNVIITSKTVPNFATSLTICNGDTVPVLNTISPNGITGTWSPAVVSNTNSGNYTFTPAPGQCATNAQFRVNVTNKTVPNFATLLTICNGDIAPTLSRISPNGITGTWSPAVVSNTTNGTYIFTPASGQCATTATLNVRVTPKIVPNFNTTLLICSGDGVPALNATSPNGISGTWSPSVINNMANGSYTFTPNSGQCATTAVLTVSINNGALPQITGPSNVCLNATIQLSNATLGGVWQSNNSNIATVDLNGIVTGIANGTATITYSLTSGNCKNSVSKIVTVNLPPNPQLKDKFICVNSQTGTLISSADLATGIPNNGNFSFAWTYNNNPLPTIINIHRATQAGIYKVVVTNLLTGCSASATAEVKISSTAVATATVAEDFERNQTITVNVTGGSGEYEFQLNDGLPQESNQFIGVFSGDYEIIVRDKNGCKELFLEVFALNYPRYFTPNGDGFHDTWNISALSNQAEAKIYIFDRYGKLIKYITPSTSGWDGTYNGQQLPSTDYWFKLQYKGRNGNDKEFKSHFSMKR